MSRAWSFLTVDEADRQFGGNLGYGDSLGSRYVWDSTVPLHRSVQPGDLAVLRDGNFVLGAGWIDGIESERRSKVRRRCPTCRSTAFKPRKKTMPVFKCSPCQTAFDTPLEEKIEVTVHVADYARTWRSATEIPAHALVPAYFTRSAQQSIRELDLGIVNALLADSLDVSLGWWIRATDPDIPGGHRRSIGRVRIGQEKFRKSLRNRFGDRCLITGPQPAAAIEAAHLYRYSDTGHHDTEGGILLRRDLHSLFDRFLLAIHPESWTVQLSPSLVAYSDLALLDGRVLAIPPQVRPRAEYIKAHLAWAKELWTIGPHAP
ncbi:HNH endonuclease signature motif containing protein [Micromonospora sp. NPDC047187]|uniref:HNH endonuclease n=1 Tax=Micromonospora sp. NPDC047187 TaxID=3155262 RepID=UPI003411988F